MLRGLRTFYDSSGLQTNAQKSNIFTTNIKNTIVEDLCELTEYTRGKLPFKFLGVPITTKRLSAIDCEMLVQKMIMKVKVWGTRNLSYAGRVQLVNSVLLHMNTYWLSMFVLPKRVLKDITGICRNYIWSGQVYTTKPPLVAWDIVCMSKKEGGLGVIDCMV